MGVFYAWRLLSKKKVNVKWYSSLKHLIKWQEEEEKIHVDLVGAFFEDIKHFFIPCDKDDDPQKSVSAAQGFLDHLAAIISKEKCILYVNGSATEEQSQRIQDGISKYVEYCEQLEQEIEAYNNNNSESTEAERDGLVGKISSLFRCTHQIPKVIFEVATEQGWNIIQAEGEAQVAIGREGGIVLSEDSDMLFYPKIGTVIRPLAIGGYQRPRYQVYHKSSILTTLGLSNAAFTAMGVLSANGYDPNPYENQLLEHVFSVLGDIQQAQPNLDSVQQFIEAFTAEMNAKTGKSVVLQDYIKSYRIFVLQEEHLQPLYDVQSNELHTAAHYMKQLH